MGARPAIKLNGVTLPPQMIAAEAQHHPARTPAAAFHAAARALIIRTLLLEEAARLGLNAEPELVAKGKRETAEEAQIRLLLERSISMHEPSEAECCAYYRDHAGQFRAPDLTEASHILFAAGPSDDAGWAEAEEAARAALAELSQRPGLFEDIARQHSDCASKSAGGRLGQLASGETAPEFEAALGLLTPGGIAATPVKTRFGFHVVRLDARVTGEVLPFEYVRDKIAAFLGERRWRQDAGGYVARLVDRATIEGVDMRAAIAA